MRVVVAGIPNPGLEVPLDLSKDWVCAGATAALDGQPTAISGVLDVQRTGRKVDVHGTIRATAPATCDRCGETTDRVVEAEVALAYLPDGSGAFEAELELGADDLDVGWYRDGSLDLSDVVREVLALSLPLRTICTDSAGCDARTEALLVKADADTPGHPAFAALRQLQ